MFPGTMLQKVRLIISSGIDIVLIYTRMLA